MKFEVPLKHLNIMVFSLTFKTTRLQQIFSKATALVLTITVWKLMVIILSEVERASFYVDGLNIP